MKMRVFIIFAIALCASAADVAENENAEPSKEKRQSQEGTLSHLVYRSAKQEQIAPVEEPQEDDRSSLRNRTSLQPASEDPGDVVDRSAREQPLNVKLSTASPSDQSTIEHNSNSIEVSSEAPQLPNVQEVDIEHRGISLEDRRQSQIPPPQDGKSYTPEEFTSLIVAGYAVTPIPDLSYDVAASNSLVSSFGPSVRPPIASPVYLNNNLPGISSPTPFALRDEQLKLNQARLELGLHHYRQRLALQQSLPPPRSSKGYTPEEFNSLIAAGYSVAPVPVNPYGGVVAQSSRADEEYRPGQVFSLNPQELLDLQPERKAPLPSNQYLQHLYGNPQQEHKQNLQQQIYYLEPQSQSGRQAPPSHAVIARPHFSHNGGEASVGAALSVSDTGSSSSGDSYSQEILALLGQAIRPQESRAQAQQSSTVQSVAPQYQQIDRYITKPSKKATKLRSKVRVEQPQPTAAPQQYLIETTNVQQQPQQQQQYRPTQQPQRLAQSLRYVPIQQAAPQLEQSLYERERPESQGLKIVPAPKLSPQSRAQFNYRLAPQASQYQPQEAAPAPKQYRLVELPRAQPIRQELRLPASSNIERPVAYLKRIPEIEKQRSVKIYDPVAPETQQPAQLYGEQFVLRPLYRSNEQRPRYEIAQTKLEPSPTKAPHSAIYVSKNIPVRSQKVRPQSLRENIEQSNIDIYQHGQSLEEQRSQLPPPKNNKAYTPEEFAALVAAGYSVTPVPISALNLEAAQSRIETVTAQPKRRLTQRRRNQYLPVRDDAP